MADNDNDGNEPDKVSAFKSLYLLSTIGIQLTVSILIGLGCGLMLDKWLGTSPWLLLLFLGFGITAGFLNVYRLATQVAKTDDE